MNEFTQKKANKNWLVSLVSEQAIPNVLFIKEYPGEYKYLFISTSKMEGKSKTKHICDTCKIAEDDYSIVKVQEDSLQNIKEMLDKFYHDNIADEDHIIVNLTLGTKIMALGVYLFFKEKEAQIHYIPIGKNHITQIFPDKKDNERHINQNVSIKEYFKAYGVQSSFSKPYSEIQTAELMFRQFNKKVIPIALLDLLRLKLRNYLRKNKNKIYTIDEINIALTGIISDEIKNQYIHLCSVLDFPDCSLSYARVKYLTGGWFEEYIYYYLRKLISDEQIGMGIQLKFQGDVPNEVDIAFISKNDLYLIEVKTGLFSKQDKDLLLEAFYKLASIGKELGLSAHNNFFTVADSCFTDDKLKVDYLKRSELLHIQVCGANQLCPENIELTLKRIFKL